MPLTPDASLRASLQNGDGPRFRSIAAAGRKGAEIAVNVATSTPPAISAPFRLAATRLETEGSPHFVGKLSKRQTADPEVRRLVDDAKARAAFAEANAP